MVSVVVCCGARRVIWREIRLCASRRELTRELLLYVGIEGRGRSTMARRVARRGRHRRLHRTVKLHGELRESRCRNVGGELSAWGAGRHGRRDGRNIGITRVCATPVATITLMLSIPIIFVVVVCTATARSPPLALAAFRAVALTAA